MLTTIVINCVGSRSQRILKGIDFIISCSNNVVTTTIIVDGVSATKNIGINGINIIIISCPNEVATTISTVDDVTTKSRKAEATSELAVTSFNRVSS